MTDNRGSHALREAFAERGKQSRISRETDISQPQLSKLAAGAPANRKDALKLRDALGIELEWWDEPAPREKRRKGHAA